MIRNYLKVAWRYLSRHKGYSLVNILGLGVSVACCLLIMLFVKSEWSFDRFHTKSDRIYRAWLREHYEGQVFTNTVTPIPLVPVLQEHLPEVEGACRVASLNVQVQSGTNRYFEPVNMVDSNFFRLFDFPLAEGRPAEALNNSSSLVITKSAARKYFGSEGAIGKTLELQLGDDKVLFTVSAVAQDPPLSSSIRYEMLIPFSQAYHIWSEKTRTAAWSNVAVESYFLLRKGTALEQTHARILSILQPLVSKVYKPGDYRITLQPLTDIHLNNDLPAGNQPVSDAKYAYILATIGVLILLIACINFITLSVARSATRALEVGVRKVMGAERKQLIGQFWGEALLLTVISLVLGIGLCLVLQKPFNQLADRELHLHFDGFTLLFCFLLALLIGLIAGIYPAWVLSAFRPIQVLKGRLRSGAQIGLFRKALIVGQFVASIFMIMGTLTVGRQLHYLRTKDLGYQRDHVVVVPTNLSRSEGAVLGERLRARLSEDPEVRGTTLSLYSMAESGWLNLGYKDDHDAFRQFRFNIVDADFVPAMGLKMAAGRAFAKGNTADSTYILVNEALVREYGWKDPIGQKLPGKYQQRVLGVVRDFHFESLHEPIRPLVLALRADSFFRYSSDVSANDAPQPRLSVRFATGDVPAQIERLRASWKQTAGDQDFSFRFLDEALNASYRQEERLGGIVKYASILSIFIACMGLFGLATLVVVRRTKEIGIRKVLGADVQRIVLLLSRDFVVLVGVAALVAFPLSWWAAGKWLQDFVYRIPIPVLGFLGAVLLALFIALATVSLQAVRAALRNPVTSLRTE